MPLTTIARLTWSQEGFVRNVVFKNVLQREWRKSGFSRIMRELWRENHGRIKSTGPISTNIFCNVFFSFPQKSSWFLSDNIKWKQAETKCRSQHGFTKLASRGRGGGSSSIWWFSAEGDGGWQRKASGLFQIWQYQVRWRSSEFSMKVSFHFLSVLGKLWTWRYLQSTRHSGVLPLALSTTASSPSCRSCSSPAELWQKLSGRRKTWVSTSSMRSLLS